MSKLASEKYNILLIILIFLIPLLSINGCFLFVNKINLDWEEKELENIALNEAETLAVEGNFSTEFAFHFKDFFESIQNTANLDEKNNSFFCDQIKNYANKIFKEPFPKYNLYVFKIPSKTQQTELIYYEGSLNTGKKTLCKAFEHLYNVNTDINNKSNESFAKILFGKFTNIDAIAQEMRGITTYTNGIHKNSYFIWDYANIENKGIYGAILLCNEIDNLGNCGRLLALKRLKSRGKAVGAFIPVYEEYGEPIYLSPLNKSKKFNEWANTLTINNKKNLDLWLTESLPQNHKLGNYSAFCYLDRNSSHIAVVLVKSIKNRLLPKWLIIINFFIIFTLLIILYLGFFFELWPQFNLKTRFIISYVLASVIPLSLLYVSSYGYLKEYEKTSEELANTELQLSLKEFDSYKLTNIKEYKSTFNNIINDPNLISIIEKEGFNNKQVTDYIVNAFENSNPDNPLPILGVKIIDEVGEGIFSKGSLATNKNIEHLFNSFISIMLNILRDKIKKESPNLELKEYKNNKEKDFVKNAYNAISGRELKSDIFNYLGIPMSRKNGDFRGYQIFNTIKINGKTKYMLLVLWDNKALDEKLIQKAIHSNALKNIKQNFIAYKIEGLKIKQVGKKTRHGTEELINKTAELAMQTSFFNKTYKYIYKDNIIVVMPAFNFNQIIFVGWVNKIDIILDLYKRISAFIVLIITSFLIIRICSSRSSSVFLKPITTLKKALDEVSLGNLNIGFIDQPNNEFGKLSNEFGKMIEDLREKERLSKLISDQAIEALKKNSKGLLNETETFYGVALVSDIRNFTGMSEKYDPTIITELLNEHFAEMAKIISDNGGLIYKFIGDAIEAVFSEKEEFQKSATERAFQAGCQMIIKLKEINNKREQNNLFTYKIGVGLCYGIMHSGTVGSLETRLDYSILGDPLKNAAKYEALSKLNPDFPIVIDEYIAEKIATIGFRLKKIESKNPNIYTLDTTGNIINYDFSLSSIKESLTNKDENINEQNISYYSLSSYTSLFKSNKNFIFYSFLILYISLLITLGVLLLNRTSISFLKSESDKYASRLTEQLKCDGVLQSSFDNLCLEFYDDLNKLDFYKNPQNLKEKIENIALKFEKRGVPLPKFCCCLLDESKIQESERIVYKGFSKELCNSMLNYAKEYIKYIDKYSNLDMTREENIDLGDKILNPIIRNFVTEGSRFYNLQQGTLFRRSSFENVGGEKMLFNTDRIYDESKNKLKAYIFCGMPENINIDILPNYYTILASNQMFMAIKNKKGWYFSSNFPEKEKDLFINDTNNTNIKNKEYYSKTIFINNESFDIYIISKDLFENYYSTNKLSIITFIFSSLILSTIFWFLETNRFKNNYSIASILRKDIFLSALIPILTVCFISYLYIKEESNIKKSELLLNMNQQMNEIENREYYYSPLCEHFFKNLTNYNDIKNSITKILNTKDEIRNEECDNLSKFLKEKLVGRNFKNIFFKQNSINPFFVIKEIILIGKDGWLSSAKENEKDKKNISIFGESLSNIYKSIYFNNNINKKNKDELKDELIYEKTIEILSSAYGSEIELKLTNLPNNLLIVANSYTSIGLYVGFFPNIENPEYILLSLIYFENDFKPYICNKRNDKLISYKNHLSSGSNDDKIFCFYSPNLHIGDFFFHDNWYLNHREDVKTVKELCQASSWINTSYIPISKIVNINGIHYLEARQGNYINDNIYASLASEYPIKEIMKNKFQYFGLIILSSLVMIFLIAQSIILELLNPMKKLIKGAIEASKGNFSFRTNLTTNDELGILCSSFDKMMKNLEEKQLMNRMVSKTALKVASDLTEIKSIKVNVVLIYITVPNFDNIMKETPSNELFYKLRKQISSISKIVIENGGDVDKIMGEKMLIAFRVKNKKPEDVAFNASQVAILISKCKDLYFEISIGVNYGEVISGYLGVGTKQDFTIIGDPVNVTARIAVFAEKLNSNRLIISRDVMKLINNNIKTEEYGEILFKGKTLPAKVYRII